MEGAFSPKMRYLSLFFRFLLDLVHHRRLLWDLTKKDLKQRYVGSYLGVLWAFIQPTITILIFWFVFQVGFRATPIHGIPFILWFVCGMVPWFFFSDAWASATGSITGNSFLVKKVVFRVSLLPIVQICSALVVNCFFLALLEIMFILYGFPPNVYHLQVVYYLFAMICLVFGLSLVTASLVVFLKDVGQFIAMLLQFTFWGTPIGWNIQMVPPLYQWIFKLNPMYYIVEGYRDTFLYHIWFWDRINLTLGFWGFTLVLMAAGVLIFKKLRPHFADVL